MTRESARQHFPRGLVQPPNGFRFGTDALLLACFAASLPGRRVLDCGTGCGPVGLGMLLSGEDSQRLVLGLDKAPEMIAAANANAQALGFGDRFAARLLDMRDLRDRPDIVSAESMDLVVANPPYRHPDSGRRPPSADRETARFEVDGGLEAFVDAAAYALVNAGRFACVHLAERLAHVVRSLAARNLEIKHILPISPRRDAPAKQMLVLARKNGRPGLRLDPPLALYEGEGAETRLSRQALRFCPFLACNASPGTFAAAAE
ncbi:putative RNA methylase [Solidesulfovibrio fructosivorans JJ]]|uniref:Putative RNA methylase n=1 Tax=Solidesulfovibrio fructosivorans JJ] TaxID=596151 RepID=E1JV03_SOLFR|nr:methyltransferase domain-containing protein [Solidesulfovibrio fructosivorans]EFL51917.1 putative RNA methylase [Solidesulfovibrio fructosivorans JJ]]